MRTAFKLFGFFCLLAAFAIGGITAPAAALAGGADLDTCVKGCAPNGDADSVKFCTSYCTCVTAELEKAGTIATLKAVASQSELEKYAFTCGGRIGITNAVNACLANCPQGEDCKTSCGCLETQLKAVGTEYDIGKFFSLVGSGDATASAKVKQIHAGCGMAGK